ncbi:MAG: CDP-glycerol glycerophosphotransferase family protein [Candidatus Cloacimonadota bacterium]|nr:CDP-glycerol glycerophosphotransferase family protein [Candidatus Cloacimonadota bacterium]
MSRLLSLIFKKPFSIFKLVYYYWLFLYYAITNKKTVVYNLHHDYFFDIFYPIGKELEKDKRIKLYYSYRYQNHKLKQYLLKKCAPKQIISNLYSPFIPFNLFICAEITGPDFPLKNMKTKAIEIYHGTGIYNLYENKDILNRFDIHFAIGPQYLPFIKEAYKDIKKKPKVYKIGYPKLDSLLNSRKQSAVLKNHYGLNNGKNTVLYAPHWNEFSSLHVFGIDLLKKLAKFEVNILVKPHNYIFIKYSSYEWKEKFKALSTEYENLKFVEQPNTQKLYPLADVMITDTGTTNGLEFSLMQKPLFIYCQNQWFQKYKNAQVEKDICNTAICFSTLNEITTIIQKFLDNDVQLKLHIEKQKKQQTKLINKYLYNYGKATSAALIAIKRELNLLSQKDN